MSTSAKAWVAEPSGRHEDRFIRDWRALQQSPFFMLWASAAVDEILSALHERMLVGPGAVPPRGPKRTPD